MFKQINEWWNELRLREKVAFLFMGLLISFLSLVAWPIVVIFGLVGGFVGSMIVIVGYFVEKHDDY